MPGGFARRAALTENEKAGMRKDTMDMKNVSLTTVVLLTLVTLLRAAPETKPGTWVDPKKAAEEHPDFLLQGEYTGEGNGQAIGLQAADMDGGQFLVSEYRGGLPGGGWDRSKIAVKLLDRVALKSRIAGLKRVERVSETLGKAAPGGAAVVFAGEKTGQIEGEVADGLLWPPAATTKEVRNFKLHVEFRVPFKPACKPSNQDRGNSGIYIFDRYECQVLDTFALDFDATNNPFRVESENRQWCGCLYKFKLADLNMAYPPLQWQTYDIDFTAPAFADGKKTKNARITVFLNGVKVQDDVELPRGTGVGGSRPEMPAGRIFFQGHGNPVAYRNIWILET
jgi:hypothetical protein